MKPQPDYSGLLAQYNALLQKHLETNMVNDKIELKDSAGNNRGSVNIRDQIRENKILSRDYDYQLNYPVVTVTNTVTNPPKRKLLYGGSITGNYKPFSLNGGKVGIGYQDRKNNVFTLSEGAISFPGSGFHSYTEVGFYKTLTIKKK